MARIVHLTDLHISHPDTECGADQRGRVDALKAVVGLINAMTRKPDFVVVSGDLANSGDLPSYQLVRDILSALRAPLVLALGNHDRRATFNEVFSPGMGDASYFHDARYGDLHVIALDSSVPGRVGGTIDVAQFAYLDAALKRHVGVAKLLVMHHPPLVDADGPAWEALDKASTDQLAQRVVGNDVAGILAGHIHVNRVSHWHGVPVVINTGLDSMMDPLETVDLRLVDRSGFAVCDWVPSGLSVTFVPLSPEARTLTVLDEARHKAFE